MRAKSKVARAALAVSAAAAVIMMAPVGTPLASAAPSSIIFSDAPGTSAPPSTLGPYSMTPFGADTQAVGASVDSVVGPTGNLRFSPSLEHCLTPNPDGCWETWSNNYSGDVYATSSDDITITLPDGTSAFYFYAEPDQFMTFSVTATSDNGTTSGAIPVAGFAGAEYFGFYTTGSSPLKSITVSATDPDGFAVGEFGISSCGYHQPASWTTSPVAGLTPGVEPLNVIISGCSNVSLESIRAGLGNWGPVTPGCLSVEQADVTGSTYADQQQQWRLESSNPASGTLVSCYQGNKLSLDGAENHVRIWNQPITGTQGAWFISASYETACADIGGKLVPANTLPTYELPIYWALGLLWHCIDGSQGSIGTDGYDRGAKDFVSEIQAVAPEQKWSVDVQTISTPAGIGEGHAGTGVPFNGTVYVVTVDQATP
jgi:hypothetical protein